MTPLHKSITQAECHNLPWQYFLFRNPLTNAQIHEIKTANIDRDHYITDGTRAGNKDGADGKNENAREYITRKNADQYPHLMGFIEDMRSPEVRHAIARLVGHDDMFENSYVRLEILHDTKQFWLEPHCDIPEKLISSLIYINDTDEDINLGTDMYDTDLNLVATVPFEHNLGYLFAGSDKWHGVEKGKKVKVERRGLQLNYVTFETDWPV